MIPLMSLLLLVLPIYQFGSDLRFSPISIFVGIVYILRDFAQREVGRKKVLIAMGVAAILTYYLADPALAIASITAFIFGELIDWIVFTFTHLKLSKRILLSNIIALPVDIIVILIGLYFAIPGAFPINFGNFIIMFMTNISSAILLFFMLKFYEK